MSATVCLTISALDVVNPARQNKRVGGLLQLKGKASRVISAADQMRWVRMVFLVSSDMLCTRKPTGKSFESLPPWGCGGETLMGAAPW